jgi:hypothetical protein
MSPRGGGGLSRESSLNSCQSSLEGLSPLECAPMECEGVAVPAGDIVGA